MQLRYKFCKILTKFIALSQTNIIETVYLSILILVLTLQFLNYHHKQCYMLPDFLYSYNNLQFAQISKM